jgi:hypothetical protein
LREPDVVALGDGFEPAARALLSRYGLELEQVPAGAPIPGSWWGEREAGLRAARLYARADTPLHSVLHEACHYVCMSPRRREALDTDAGGDYDEENAVCYLQVLLADALEGFDRARMFADMDAWGYSFRLGSAQAWFEQDAADALEWLRRHGLADAAPRPTWRLRQV